MNNETKNLVYYIDLIVKEMIYNYKCKLESHTFVNSLSNNQYCHEFVTPTKQLIANFYALLDYNKNSHTLHKLHKNLKKLNSCSLTKEQKDVIDSLDKYLKKFDGSNKTYIGLLNIRHKYVAHFNIKTKIQETVDIIIEFISKKLTNEKGNIFVLATVDKREQMMEDRLGKLTPEENKELSNRICAEKSLKGSFYSTIRIIHIPVIDDIGDDECLCYLKEIINIIDEIIKVFCISIDYYTSCMECYKHSIIDKGLEQFKLNPRNP